MEKLHLDPIGKIKNTDEGTKIILNEELELGLMGIEGFSHINILWWFSECDNNDDRNTMTLPSPYKKAPSLLGTFATRSPMRPNPIAISCSQITFIDTKKGEIGLTYIDAFDDTPVLDIKPYTPSLDRVMHCKVPSWCSHWPGCYEESGDFDWESEFTDS